MPEIVIAFTVSGQREKYLKKALESWSKVHGIASAQLIFCVEPAPAFPLSDFTSWTAKAFPGSVVVANPSVFGIVKNTKQAFESAFYLGARLAVLAEEDLVVSADVLSYLHWAMVEYERDQSVAAICAHVKESQLKDPSLACRVPWFNPLVCATWKDRWESLMAPGWKAWQDGVPDNTAWDHNLRQLLGAAAKTCVFPVQSRVLHIGEISTTYGASLSEYMYRDSVSGCFAPDHPSGAYREVAYTEVPGFVV